jgi:hypothetical protein
MKPALVRLIVRVTAIAIAVAAVIDPVFSISRPPRTALVVVNLTNGEDAIDRVRSAAAQSDLVVRAANGTLLPCAPDERCVIVADGSIETAVPADLKHPLSLVLDKPSSSPNIELQQVMASSSHFAAAGTMRVTLARNGSIATTDLRVTDAGALVGSASHEWQQETSATIEIAWWPLASGARTLRVEAIPAKGEMTTIDNQVDVAVDVSHERGRVLIFDARPSWSNTFVRRALEDDPRFIVGHRARIAPALTAGTTGAKLDEQVLDATDVVVVGGPDALTAGDVALLERFVRVRGGTLMLLPEQRASGAAQRLFPEGWSEHLTQSPEHISALYATEILRGPEGSLDTVLARSGSEAAIVWMPLGDGRVVISGAIDAWRHREKDADAFDRFWRSIAAEGAIAAASPSLTIGQPLIASDASTSFTLRDRRMAPLQSTSASATVRCDDGSAHAVRLRPVGILGEFAGRTAATGTSCIIEANINDRRVTASFASARRPQRGTSSVIAKLERAARDSGGVVVASGDEASLVRALSSENQPASQVVSVRPMRAPWWIIPFAGCLTIEWWLRRREGLR